MTNSNGVLVIIGGAEDKVDKRQILRRFVEIAGGQRAHIAVIAAASEVPNEIFSLYQQTFLELGATHVTALSISNRDHANSNPTTSLIEAATGVFFTGGNQLKLTQLLGGTKVDTLLHRKHEEGMPIAGTSAGAAMMSNIMITGGETETPYRIGMVELSPGMDFIPGVLIDQHFEQRGRLRRLLSAVAQYPHDIGIGIDEDTAVIVSDSIAEVTGSGSVTIIDAREITYTNLDKLNKSDLLTLCGVKIHILAAGDKFNIKNRQPLCK